MPSRKACTPAQHEQVKMMLEIGMDLKTIASSVTPPVSYNTVCKMARNYRSFSTTKTPRMVSQGRPCLITPFMEQVGCFYPQGGRER
jgi:hypothetical protein